MALGFLSFFFIMFSPFKGLIGKDGRKGCILITCIVFSGEKKREGGGDLNGVWNREGGRSNEGRWGSLNESLPLPTG